MFLEFFANLRQAHVPATPREYLDLMRALEDDLAQMSVDEFYRLARALLVKDERNLDRFDVVFAATFKGVLSVAAAVEARDLPEEWLRRMIERYLSPEERVADREARFREADGDIAPAPRRAEGPPSGRLEMDRHRRRHRPSAPMATIPRACASARTKAVGAAPSRSGTGGSSRTSTATRSSGRATSSWRCGGFGDSPAKGAADELDLDGTIRSTADKGYIDVQLRPERRNAVKVLLFLDVGGSMDWHVEAAEQLFSAAKSQFKRLDHFYFHNCLYESVWKNNRRRHDERVPTRDLINSYRRDYRVVFVGDASMSPHEIMAPGGSVEHLNPEPGRVWLERAILAWPRTVWINPTPPSAWNHSLSTTMIAEIFQHRMFPLTPDGVEAAMRALAALMLARYQAAARHSLTTSTEHCAWRTIVLAFEPKQVVRHDRTMRTDNDKVGVPFGRFLQELVIDSARPRRGALAFGRQIDAGENRVERLLGPLRLLDVEIDRHIFHERGRHDRLDIDQPQFAAARLRQLHRLRQPLRNWGRLGEIDRENDALVHGNPSFNAKPLARTRHDA